MYSFVDSCLILVTRRTTLRGNQFDAQPWKRVFVILRSKLRIPFGVQAPARARGECGVHLHIQIAVSKLDRQALP